MDAVPGPSTSSASTTKPKNLNISPQAENVRNLNILVLGESGAGKSSFIRGFLYTGFMNTLEEAENNSLPIPTVSPEVENLEVTDEARKVKMHLIPSKLVNNRINYYFIDTPGICDSQQVCEENCDIILAYLRELEHVHACILVLKPNISAIQYVEIGLLQILKRLHSKIGENLIFIFTNCTSSEGVSSELMEAVKLMVNRINATQTLGSVSFNLNCFYFDYTIHQHLHHKRNEDVVATNRDALMESWKNFRHQYARMFVYLVVVRCYTPEKPGQRSINSIVKLIFYLSQPLMDVMLLLINNLYLITTHRNKLENLEHHTSHAIKQLLDIPQIKLEAIALNEPRTVCSNINCNKLYKLKLKDVYKTQYSTCHAPCCLTNPTNSSHGGPILSDCTRMVNGTCATCKCPYTNHMHVYYLTKASKNLVEPPYDVRKIPNKKKCEVAANKLLSVLTEREDNLEKELKEVTSSIILFANFLQLHAAHAPPFENFFQLMIQSEETIGKDLNQSAIETLEMIFNEYKFQIKDYTSENVITKSLFQLCNSMKPHWVYLRMEQLVKLDIVGETIQELIKAQDISRKWEFLQSYPMYTYPLINVLLDNIEELEQIHNIQSGDVANKNEDPNSASNTRSDDESLSNIESLAIEEEVTSDENNEEPSKS